MCGGTTFLPSPETIDHLFRCSSLGVMKFISILRRRFVSKLCYFASLYQRTLFQEHTDQFLCFCTNPNFSPFFVAAEPWIFPATYLRFILKYYQNQKFFNFDEFSVVSVAKLNVYGRGLQNYYQIMHLKTRYR